MHSPDKALRNQGAGVVVIAFFIGFMAVGVELIFFLFKLLKRVAALKDEGSVKLEGNAGVPTTLRLYIRIRNNVIIFSFLISIIVGNYIIQIASYTFYGTEMSKIIVDKRLGAFSFNYGTSGFLIYTKWICSVYLCYRSYPQYDKDTHTLTFMEKTISYLTGFTFASAVMCFSFPLYDIDNSIRNSTIGMFFAWTIWEVAMLGNTKFFSRDQELSACNNFVEGKVISWSHYFNFIFEACCK